MIKAQTSYYFTINDGVYDTTVTLEVNEEDAGKGNMTIKYNQDRWRTKEEHIALLSGIIATLQTVTITE